MFLSRLIPIGVVLATVSCGRIANVLQLDPTPRPRTHPDSVRLLVEEPRQPYTVIALVSAVSNRFLFFGKSERTRVLEAAARLGGEAVLLGHGSYSQVSTGGEYGGIVPVLSGKVIVFTDNTRSH